MRAFEPIGEIVALRKESVDRNWNLVDQAPEHRVALRKESVDRNFCYEVQANAFTGSLSARRAWIEICILWPARLRENVALRKESVDRNIVGPSAYRTSSSSLSARRAWIEMTYVIRLPRCQVCRSPQGERG